MSLFLGNTAQYSNASVDPEKIKIAEIQYDAMSSTFQKLFSTCREKCIPEEYGESELNTGEMCCVDRCVAKYMKVNTLIGTSLQTSGFQTGYMPEYQKILAMMDKNQKNQ